MNTGKVLISWYNQNKRDLPWRSTRNPYLIWVSEIIMQQTRISQGLPYYIKFTEQFPTVQKLAESTLDRVYLVWQGLGYYSRARNMHLTAQKIVTEYKGNFPESSAALLQLKGIGNYTAAAIASVCYNEKIPAIDGNVLRVISRLYNIEYPVDKAMGKKMVSTISMDILGNNHPGTYNQAIMDLGALICTPTQPKCDNCPLSDKCISLIQNTIANRPVKSVKTLQRPRYFVYLYFRNNDNTIIMQRKEGDIWNGLFEFPLWESEYQIKQEEFMCKNEIVNLTKGLTISEIDFYIPKVHKLSHQLIYSLFIEIVTNKLPTIPNSKTISINKLDEYALPKIIENYLTRKLKK
ncbi:MAG: A/G-specific adenine glycosylase [Salinivirgaceae bacterium]